VKFPKWQLPKCEIFQAATSQVCPSRSARPVCSLAVVTWDIAHLGSLGKVSLGKSPLGKCLGKNT